MTNSTQRRLKSLERGASQLPPAEAEIRMKSDITAKEVARIYFQELKRFNTGDPTFRKASRMAKEKIKNMTAKEIYDTYAKDLAEVGVTLKPPD